MKQFYANYVQRVERARNVLGRPMTLCEKILYSHLYDIDSIQVLERQVSYANFRPDRVAMQDATAQMALLQFMNAGKDKVSVPSTVHCDHLICAFEGAEKDLPAACQTNKEVYDFLASAAARYGLGFFKPGAGIIHQEVLENFAFPGGMMVGTDSHTPNAGGLGMVAVGVGGADAVDVMTGMEWELKMPKIIGVRLSGKLGGWASAKDVILKLAGILTVKGGTNAIIEYFGEGCESLSCTGKATICNMGAEVGATCSLFPYDVRMADYLKATSRADVAALADACQADLRADAEVAAEPEKYYDRVIEIDLSSLTPYINGPFTPDAACSIKDMQARVQENAFPEDVEVSLIGSCTNSSYQDLARAASVAKAALQQGLKPKAKLIINPGSEQIYKTALRDGIIDIFRQAGALIMCNACGPCIGQWKRVTDDNTRRNSIVTSFNRNFAKRADGNPNTHAFIVSPEMAVALAFSGKLFFNPDSDTIDGFTLPMPNGDELPQGGFVACPDAYVEPSESKEDPIIREGSERLQKLQPFAPWDGQDFEDLHLLIKTQGKCTTDHISMAGPWLRFRGHLENISDNLLMGAVNAFNGQTNQVYNDLKNEYMAVSASARAYKAVGEGSIVVAEDNYGEGSSREHAAMEPRYLNVKVILAKSFARIHETNLKKQGVLALTFENPADYDKVQEGDCISVACQQIQPGSKIAIRLTHKDGSQDTFNALHSYNEQQIEWMRAGSALNSLKKNL